MPNTAKRPDGKPHPPIPVSEITAFNYACVDQEVIVSYDPAMLVDRPGRRPDQRFGQLPKFDWSGDPYYFRQATQLAAYDKLTSLGHTDGLPPRETLSSSVLGYAFNGDPHIELPVRMASPDEVKSLSQPFSSCTTPIIFQSLWMHNLNEWISRGPVAFHKLQGLERRNGTKQKTVLPRNLSIVLHSPLKIPVPKWNYEALKPFSDYTPSSLADFSSRLPCHTPSASTAEGTHTRCFRRLLVWRYVREDRPYTAREIGRTMLKYHASTLDALDRSEKTFWKGGADNPSVMRVLIEKRIAYTKTGTRQFLELDTLLAACNAAGSNWRHAAHSNGKESGDDGAAASSSSRWTTVECVAHAFGKHPKGILHDMWVMRHVDVFVTFHGAGEMNAIFMPLHSSLVEVRGINASFSLADHWHPQISRGSGFQYFWWGLFVQDPTLVGKSGLDAEVRA